MWGKNNHILSCRYTEWNAVATWIAAQTCSLRCLAEMAEPSSQRKRERRSHVTGVLKANSSHDEMRRNQTVRLWPTLDSVYWSFSPSWTQFRDNKKPRLPSFTQQTHVNGSNCGVKCGRVDPPALTAAAAAAQHHFSPRACSCFPQGWKSASCSAWKWKCLTLRPDSSSGLWS